ncbi:hypothetical protein YC2023_076159 [Brassica napus]
MQQPASKEVFFRLFQFLMFQPFLAILITKKRSENRLLKHTHRRKMASLFNKFQQAVGVLAKSTTFAKNPKATTI